MEYQQTEQNEWELYKRGLTKYHSAPDYLDYSQESRPEPQIVKQDCFSMRIKINTLLSKAKTKKEKKPMLKLLGWRTHLVDYIYFKHEVGKE